MSNIVIKAEHLSKMYRLGVINNGTLWRDIQTWTALKTGKVDPHSKIGEDKYSRDADRFWALKDVNFEIEQGDRVGIIGKNGAGKSTLLKLLSRVTSPSEGTIKIKGKIASLLEVGTGFNGELTGRENIYLNGTILGMKKRQIDRKLDEIIDFSEIEHHIDTPVKRYSSGMYVRLAFAVAAHLDSEILIADEVLAVGDAAFQKKALGKMNDLSTGQGRTVLFVSHQINAIKILCNKGIVMDSGKIMINSDINAAIKFYLDSANSKTISSFNLFSDEHFDLLSFNLVDKNHDQHIHSIAASDSSFVRISFNYKQKNAFFNIGYAIYSSYGDLIYWTFSTDGENSEWPDIVLGVNTLIAPIPTHFLNEGDYEIRIMASLHFQKWLINPEHSDSRIRFSVVGGLSKSPYWYEKRPGLCAPLLKWELE